MNGRTSSVFFLMLIFASIFCVIPNVSVAEELLLKDKQKWLGHKSSKEEFTTCNNTVLEIGNGKIVKTDETCRGMPTPSPFAAELVSYDRNSNIVELTTTGGKKANFYILRADYPADKLEMLKAGVRIEGFVPAQGRLDIKKIGGELVQ